ncbi:MAG: methyltransferase domain-containing protein [Candidatus Methanoperedens sp.]|nr:methyltransferase domain-containing protein [Candidatus Methanoperedens sp.]MCE8428764.1 methyltransferase domain-containing protein [Candidatus Methanoperedens sp.]
MGLECGSTPIDKFYNEHYAQYLMDREELLDARLRLVLNLFRDKKPANILDIGCGNGNFTTLLGKVTNAKVIGIDVSETAVAIASRNIEAYRVDVGQDVYPFDDGYFESVFCGEIIEHLFDTDHLLNEINRVMANDAFCVLTTPNLAAWYNRISLALGYQPFYTEVSVYHNVGKLSSAGGPTSTGHIRGFTYRSLMELLKKHKFKIIRIFGVHDFHIPAPLSLIERTAAHFPSLASCIAVVFKKA